MSPKIGFVLMTFCLSTFGIEYNWVGSAGGGDDASWSDPNNWSPPGVPDGGGDTSVVIGGSADVHLFASTEVEIADLELGGSCVLTIHSQGGLGVTSQMTNNGQIKLFDASSATGWAIFSPAPGVIVEGTGSIEFVSSFGNFILCNTGTPIIGSGQSLVGLPASHGVIATDIENRGLIRADGSELEVHCIANQSMIEIINSGNILMNAYDSITNTPAATILIDLGSVFELHAGNSIVGGTINGAGEIEIEDSLGSIDTPILEDVTINDTVINIDNQPLDLKGSFWNNGQVNLGGPNAVLDLQNPMVVDGDGEIVFRSSSTSLISGALTIGASQTVRTDVGGSGQFDAVNYGTVEANAGTLAIGGTNAGTMMSTLGGQLTLGALDNAGHVIQAYGATSLIHSADGIITGGTLRGPGTLTLDSEITLVDVTLDGGLHCQVDDSQTLNVQGTLTNDIDLELLGGANLSAPGMVDLNGSGTMTSTGSGRINVVGHSVSGSTLSIGENQVFNIQDNSSLHFLSETLNYGEINILDGIARFDESTINLGTLSIENGEQLVLGVGITFINDVTGLVTGEGTVIQLGGDAPINAGTLAPGLHLGTMQFTRDLVLCSSGHLALEISNTHHDSVDVGSTVTLDGNIDIYFLGGFFPGPMESFTLISAAEVVGTFDNATPITGNEAPIYFGDDQCKIRYETDSVVLCDCNFLSDLSIEKSVDHGVSRPEGTVRYTLIAHNDGPADATGVLVEDQLPNGFSHLYDTCGVDPGPPITWEVGDLAADVSAVCEVDVTIDSQADCHYLNGATISGIELESSIANNTSPPVNVLVSEDFMDLIELWPDFVTARVPDFVDSVNCALPDD